MTTTITYDKYYNNIIATVNLGQDLPEWLEKELRNFDIFSSPAQSYMPARRKLENLVVACDQDNRFNPSVAEIHRNQKLIEDLLIAGAVA